MTRWIPHQMLAAPVEPWKSGDPMKELDRASIVEFLERHADLLKGRVLDYGCGKFARPEDLRYRGLVLARGAEYFPWDPFNAREWSSELAPTIAAGVSVFDAVFSIQMLADAENPALCLLEIERLLKPGGHLILTYTTCWREADVNDKWRYTFSGMDLLVKRNTTFEILEHVRRAEVFIQNFCFCLGGGIVLKKPE